MGSMSRVRTFYSFKGGVGRTAALANVAVALANRGRRVVCVDFDLESPGLATYLRPRLSPDDPNVSGILEHIRRWQTADERPRVSDLLIDCDPPGQARGSVQLIAAGRMTEDYDARALQLDWQEIVVGDGGALVADLREQLAHELDADDVLIDSRTGFTDTGNLCTWLLADEVIVLFVLHEQGISGAERVARRIAELQREDSSVGPNRVLLVPSRVEESDSTQVDEWIRHARTSLHGLGELLFGREERIPYDREAAFGERILVRAEGREGALPGAYERLTERLVGAAPQAPAVTHNRPSLRRARALHEQLHAGVGLWRRWESSRASEDASPAATLTLGRDLLDQQTSLLRLRDEIAASWPEAVSLVSPAPHNLKAWEDLVGEITTTLERSHDEHIALKTTLEERLRALQSEAALDHETQQEVARETERLRDLVDAGRAADARQLTADLEDLLRRQQTGNLLAKNQLELRQLKLLRPDEIAQLRWLDERLIDETLSSNSAWERLLNLLRLRSAFSAELTTQHGQALDALATLAQVDAPCRAAATETILAALERGWGELLNGRVSWSRSAISATSQEIRPFSEELAGQAHRVAPLAQALASVEDPRAIGLDEAMRTAGDDAVLRAALRAALDPPPRAAPLACWLLYGDPADADAQHALGRSLARSYRLHDAIWWATTLHAPRDLCELIACEAADVQDWGALSVLLSTTNLEAAELPVVRLLASAARDKKLIPPANHPLWNVKPVGDLDGLLTTLRAAEWVRRWRALEAKVDGLHGFAAWSGSNEHYVRGFQQHWRTTMSHVADANGRANRANASKREFGQVIQDIKQGSPKARLPDGAARQKYMDEFRLIADELRAISNEVPDNCQIRTLLQSPPAVPIPLLKARVLMRWLKQPPVRRPAPADLWRHELISPTSNPEETRTQLLEMELGLRTPERVVAEAQRTQRFKAALTAARIAQPPAEAAVREGYARWCQDQRQEANTLRDRLEATPTSALLKETLGDLEGALDQLPDPATLEQAEDHVFARVVDLVTELHAAVELAEEEFERQRAALRRDCEEIGERLKDELSKIMRNKALTATRSHVANMFTLVEQAEEAPDTTRLARLEEQITAWAQGDTTWIGELEGQAPASKPPLAQHAGTGVALSWSTFSPQTRATHQEESRERGAPQPPPEPPFNTWAKERLEGRARALAAHASNATSWELGDWLVTHGKIELLDRRPERALDWFLDAWRWAAQPKVLQRQDTNDWHQGLAWGVGISLAALGADADLRARILGPENLDALFHLPFGELPLDLLLHQDRLRELGALLLRLERVGRLVIERALGPWLQSNPVAATELIPGLFSRRERTKLSVILTAALAHQLGLTDLRERLNGALRDHPTPDELILGIERVVSPLVEGSSFAEAIMTALRALRTADESSNNDVVIRYPDPTLPLEPDERFIVTLELNPGRSTMFSALVIPELLDSNDVVIQGAFRRAAPLPLLRTGEPRDVALTTSNEGDRGAARSLRSYVDAWTPDGTQRLKSRHTAAPVQPRKLTALPEAVDNPYVVGRGLHSGAPMYGRDAEIAGVIDALIGKAQDNAVLVVGDRRVGKTSVLNRLCASPRVRERYQAVAQIILENLTESTSAATLFRVHLLNPILREAGLDPHANPAAFETDPEEAFKAQMRQLDDELARRDSRALVVIDEAERLFELAEAAGGGFGKEVIATLRSVIQSCSRVSFLLAGVTDVLIDHTSSRKDRLFGLAIRKDLRGLPDSAVRELLTEPVHELYGWTDAAVELVIRQTNRQPYLVAAVAQQVFDRARRDGLRIITTEDVDTIMREELVAKTRWYSDFDRALQRREADWPAAVALASVQVGYGYARVEDIRSALRRQPVVLPSASELKDRLAELSRSRLTTMFEQRPGHPDQFRLSIGLYARYLRAEHERAQRLLRV
jgi:MinD-like ATPase involved in chromosome partitioning or flagellar assembly/GTPase SAR1 family protein